MAADYDPTDLLAEADRDAERAKNADQEKEQEARDWQFLLGDARGRRVVWRLLEKAGVFRVSFVPDAMQLAFNEGNRNLGLMVQAKVIEHAPGAYLEMLKESAR